MKKEERGSIDQNVRFDGKINGSNSLITNLYYSCQAKRVLNLLTNAEDGVRS